MEIESVSIREVENGWIVSARGTKGSGDDKEWINEEFAFTKKPEAKDKMVELVNSI